MKKEITEKAESEFWKSKPTKQQIKNFARRWSVPDDRGCWMDDEAIRKNIVDELTESMMDHFDYDDADEFDNDYFTALGSPLDEIIEDVVDDVLTARDGEQAEMMIDRIRELIVSNREVKNADGVVLFQALLNLAVEALVPSEEGAILLERLKQTTLEVAAESAGKPETHTLETIEFKLS